MMVNKEKIIKEKLMMTRNLEEAVELIFGQRPMGRPRRGISGRDCIFTREAMTGNTAVEYDNLGKIGRLETYRRIAEDFKIRTDCYGSGIGPILEVGCGSGLLTLELAEQTNSPEIIGLDLSDDMITLAQANLSRRSKERIEETLEFWKRLPPSYARYQDDCKRLEDTPPLGQVRYVQGNVYELEQIGFQNVGYVLCRNALHRFQYPERALYQMHRVLSPQGKLYIRDVRRDANWQTVLTRIGERRWQTQSLVRDYVGAMASALTPQELKKILSRLGIARFKITDGRYLREGLCEGGIEPPGNIREYESETEYVCVIQSGLS